MPGLTRRHGVDIVLLSGAAVARVSALAQGGRVPQRARRLRHRGRQRFLPSERRTPRSRDCPCQTLDRVRRRAGRARNPHLLAVLSSRGSRLKRPESWRSTQSKNAATYAGKYGVFLALENHGGLTTEVDGMLAIVRSIQSPWFGVNLDTGNFQSADPYGDLAKLAPYTINVQVKVVMHPEGQPSQPTDFAPPRRDPPHERLPWLHRAGVRRTWRPAHGMPQAPRRTPPGVHRGLIGLATYGVEANSLRIVASDRKRPRSTKGMASRRTHAVW